MANWGGAASGAASGAAAGSMFGPWGAAIGGIGGGLFGAFGGDAANGQNAQRENVSLLRPYQENLHRQSVRAAQRRGAGGAFGDVADYYRNNLSDNSADFNAFAAPEIRRYNEDIIPGLSEQFAGMGSGGLSSSGFRNAAVGAGTDLSERLGAIRANLRQQSAQGLMGIGQQALNPYTSNMETQESSPGFLASAAPGIAEAATSYWGNKWKNGNSVGANSSPYGNLASNAALAGR